MLSFFLPSSPFTQMILSKRCALTLPLLLFIYFSLSKFFFSSLLNRFNVQLLESTSRIQARFTIIKGHLLSCLACFILFILLLLFKPCLVSFFFVCKYYSVNPFGFGEGNKKSLTENVNILAFDSTPQELIVLLLFRLCPRFSHKSRKATADFVPASAQGNADCTRANGQLQRSCML
jgi:hypothetical protein